MRWSKLGLVYGADGRQPWAQSHAMIPTPVRMGPDRIRVYCTFCDAQGRGRPGYVDVAAEDPTRVLDVSSRPLLELGRPGTFDENGLLTCSVLPLADGRTLLYYAGFELGTQIRYRLLTGLAISEDGGHRFQRVSETPVLERSSRELFVRGGPWALAEADRVRLWYVGGSEWIDVGGKSMPVYDIRYLESVDGIQFAPEGQVQVTVGLDDEFGFGRPCVIPHPDGGYEMFYSIRRPSVNAYRLGYARSADGLQWERRDADLQLDVSTDGFDSQAIMYAAPIRIEGVLYVFYNGNDFGRDGFAVARLDPA